jgi:hypothetical protein
MRLNLDLTHVEQESEKIFSYIPDGEYDVRLTHADLKETKSGGSQLILGYKVVSGEHTGKMIADRLNIVNASTEAVRISLERLKTVAIAVGHKDPNKIADTDELLTGQEFTIITKTDSFVNDKGETINSSKVKSVIVTKHTPSEAAPQVQKPAVSQPWKK